MAPWDEMKKALRDLGDRAISSASELDARDAKRAAGDLAEHAAKLGRQLRGACETLTERSGNGAEDASESRGDSAPSDAPLAHEEDERAGSGKKRDGLLPIDLLHRTVIAVIAVGVALVAAALAGAPREEAAPVPPPEEHEYRIEVSGKENLLFSRYDVDVSLGDVSLGTLSHGGFSGYELSLFEGSYPLQASKIDDEQVSGSITFELDDSQRFPSLRCPASVIASRSRDCLTMMRMTGEPIDSRTLRISRANARSQLSTSLKRLDTSEMDSRSPARTTVKSLNRPRSATS